MATVFWNTRRDSRCPKVIFQEDLLAQLTLWRNEGDKIVLMLDANEDLSHGKLEKALKEQLNMIDAVKARSNCPGPNTFHTGSKQVDGIWVTQDLDISLACFLPFFFGAGDHRGILIDLYSSSVLGNTLTTIKKPKTRRLIVQDKKNTRIILMFSQTI